LCEALGAPGLARDPRFASVADRLAHEEALDAALAERTRGFEPAALMHRLQAAGVEAGVVQTCADLLQDPQLAHRGHFVRLQHRHLGELSFEHYGIRFSESPRRLATPGPDLGEHNLQVLTGVGYGEDEIRSLVESGVLA